MGCVVITPGYRATSDEAWRPSACESLVLLVGMVTGVAVAAVNFPGHISLAVCVISLSVAYGAGLRGWNMFRAGLWGSAFGIATLTIVSQTPLPRSGREAAVLGSAVISVWTYVTHVAALPRGVLVIVWLTMVGVSVAGLLVDGVAFFISLLGLAALFVVTTSVILKQLRAE